MIETMIFKALAFAAIAFVVHHFVRWNKERKGKR